MGYQHRIFLVLGATAFAFAFQWVYLTWLYPTYGFFGFAYNPPPMGYLAFTILLSIAPSFWLPNVLTRPSQMVCWVLYLIVIIPSMFVAVYVEYRPLTEIAMLQATLFIGFVIISLGSLLPLARIQPKPIAPIPFQTLLVFTSFMLNVWVYFQFRGQFQFVGFDRVYEVRIDALRQTQDTFTGYASMWLAFAINPCLIGYGLHFRRKFVFLIGSAGQMFLYGTAAMKGILLSIFAIPLLYFALSGRNAQFGKRLVWGTVAVFVSLNLLNAELGGEPGEPGYWPSVLLFMRTFGVPGLSTAVYHDFFTDHPFTYWSHVKGVNLFISYPYQRPVHMEVGMFLSGDENLSANAHFWCQDGITALGLPGILVASLLFVLVFWFFDSLAASHEIKLTGTLICLAALNIANSSLFTMCFSGGLFVLMLLIYWMPHPRVLPRQPNPVLANPARVVHDALS